MKKIGLFTFLILIAGSLFAQLDEGKKMLNYERFQSASKIFKSMLDKDPNNTEAAYWLGQTYIQNVENADTAAAKELYQKTLQANPNDAWMMIGVGEIELMEGKTNDARNHFEAAINATKKRNLPEILIAVGRANVDTKAGDANYAVEKLKQAVDRDKKSVEGYIALGDAYRKLIDGANATTAYQNALLIDPHAARASFMMGRIYETQGYTQEPIYMRFYNDAMEKDPNFAPVYYWLYTYYYNRDVNKAREYLNKYVAVADNNSKLCYAEASLYYVSKMYQETIAKADSCITGASGEKPFPNLFGLKAYAFEKLNDTAHALQAFQEFFARVNPEKIGPKDYATYGKVLLAYPDKRAMAEEMIDKAIETDTIKQNKLDYVTDIAKSMYSKKNYDEASKWYVKLLKMDTAFGKVDLYWAGISSYLASKYKTADSVFKIYQNKYPDDLLGWFYGGRSLEGIDTSGALGLAKPDYDQVISLSENISNKDSIKNMLVPSYRYMVAYFYNIKNNVDSAYYYNGKILEVVPDDQNALTNRPIFEAMLKKSGSSAKKEDQQK